MNTDWSTVKYEHVVYACNLFDSGRCKPTHHARNTFLALNGKRYPAKFIRGLAFELATGVRLDPNTDYEGGEQTAKFLKKLGLEIEYKGQAY